ncbi:MAG TPA: T9SS type A sorting domain-containing protein, partial [Saprospiraceae bacterium]|nr:T9SS type A sorting domain-containing protein [Saprospiraceae bacterium]
AGRYATHFLSVSGVEPAPSFARNLQLSPNPSSGLVFADFDSFTGGKLHFTVRNMQGALMQSKDLNWPAGNARQAVDLGTLPKGVYTLEWTSEQSSVRRKVLVQ